jgi:uncharacterized protein (DUF924 family)
MPADDVLAFWFAGATEPRAEWCRKDPAFDALIAERFGDAIEAALRGELDSWSAAPRSALARLLLLDQFTRNVFRGTARAFAGDALALAGARALVASGDDLRLPPLQRVFVYMPFEHAEDLASQDEALRCFGALAPEAPALAEYQVTWARKHHDVIARFGRFPHRNAVLGRSSTAEELAYLAQPGAGF